MMGKDHVNSTCYLEGPIWPYYGPRHTPDEPQVNQLARCSDSTIPWRRKTQGPTPTHSLCLAHHTTSPTSPTPTQVVFCLWCQSAQQCFLVPLQLGAAKSTECQRILHRHCQVLHSQEVQDILVEVREMR